ncbi:uncharacterized protein LOC124418924 [Lucilia cuprina]|uniref:uncharacterized protein LOC124418924 n=1 Tax=Lucilia cuprina TaxID=7375 RepID=UPI001F0535BC|nr:uncharacterized protein LOC124418924 [Lucilia cuprina]XP_046802818.1 uncharacterized protein LOC124418924 [Lucilia cuprina]
MFFINIHTYIVFLIIFNIFLIEINAKEIKNDVTTSPTPTTTLQRTTSEGYVVESSDLTKRDIKTKDLTAANTLGVAAKSYDPPPEFYRGPGSTGHFISTVEAPQYNNNYKPSNGFISRPIAFPDTHNANSNNNNQHNKYNGGGTQDNSDVHLANSYNSWQHLKGKVGVLLNKKGALQDRISVGHYTTSDHGSSSNGGYAYESRPYGGKEHHVEYIPTNPHYGGSVPTTAHTGGYYGSSAIAEGIPFDVYGGKNHYSSSAGGDYASYSYAEGHEPAAHKSHPDISQKALLAKSFLIPLASAAVLGIAAALVSNPLLLQLGTVSGVAPGAAILGKRRRRDLTTSATLNDKSTNSLNLALTSVEGSKKDSSLLAYSAHHQRQNLHHHPRFVRT